MNNNISQNISNYIIKSKRTQNVLKFIDKNPSLSTGITAFMVTSTIRPATIMLTPCKDKDDKKYAVAKSISSGVTDLCLSSLLFIPLARFLDKSKKHLTENKCLIYNKNIKSAEALTSFTNRMGRICVAPLSAMVLYHMLPIIKNKIFSKKGENSENKPLLFNSKNPNNSKFFNKFV